MVRRIARKENSPPQQSVPPSRSVLSRRKKLFYSLVQIVLIGGIIELGFRLSPYQDRGKTVGGFTVPDPDLIWRLKPGTVGALATNELGFRDDAYQPTADTKVLVLGDSVTWGDGLSEYRYGYVYLLQQALQRLTPDGTVDVINTGVPGYSTFQQAAYLKLRGLDLGPDVIVLQFCLNDVVERYQSLVAYGGDNVFLGIDTRESLRGFYGFLVRHSKAFERGSRWLQKLARGAQAYEVEQLASDSLSPQLIAAWEQVERELDEIRLTAEANGMPLLLMIAPYRFQLDRPETTRQPQQRLLAYCATYDLVCVDLLPGFIASPEDRPLFKDDNHFSAYGHYRAAELMIEPVRTLLSQSTVDDDD